MVKDMPEPVAPILLHGKKIFGNSTLRLMCGLRNQILQEMNEGNLLLFQLMAWVISVWVITVRRANNGIMTSGSMTVCRYVDSKRQLPRFGSCITRIICNWYQWLCGNRRCYDRG